jgi:hypothetical protein
VKIASNIIFGITSFEPGLRILISLLLIGSIYFNADADPDPAFHFNADKDPDPAPL